MNSQSLPAFRCEECGYVYDPLEGDPDSHIPPGAPFEAVPDDWCCPVCNVSKKTFRLLS